MIQFRNTIIGHNKPLISIESLKLEEGQLYFLMGKNGSGKSTLFKSITTQVNPIEGSIELNGTDVELLTPQQLSTALTFVEPTITASDYLSVFNFVALGRTPYTNALGKLQEEDKRKVNDAIELVGIDHLKNRYINEISDGEKQLSSVARAIAQETPIILLDEPTAFLDYSNKIQILEILKSVSSQLNKCILISTHDVEISLQTDAKYLIVNKETKHLDSFDKAPSKNELISLAY